MITNEGIAQLADLETLAAHIAIRRVLTEYGYRVDTCHPVEAAALFTEDGVMEYAPGAQAVGREAIAELASGVWNFAATYHQMTNFRIDVAGDKAASQCYVYAWHRFPDTSAQEDAYVWGQYRDELVRMNGRWLISRREIRVAGATNFSGIGLPFERVPQPMASTER